MEMNFDEVESLDTVPEPFRPLYAQNDGGKFSVNPEYKSLADTYIGLNRSLKAARAEAKAKGTQVVDLSPLSEFGTTPDEIKTTVQTKLEELQAELAKGGQAKLNLDKIKQDLAEAHSKELTKQQTRAQALETQLYSVLVENEATLAVAELKGIPELLMPFIKNQVKVKDEGGRFAAFIVDNQGDQRYSGITGQPMTIKELVAEMKANEKFGRLFESDVQGGGGKPPVQNPGGYKPPAKILSANDKISAGLNKSFRR